MRRRPPFAGGLASQTAARPVVEVVNRHYRQGVSGTTGNGDCREPGLQGLFQFSLDAFDAAVIALENQGRPMLLEQPFQVPGDLLAVKGSGCGAELFIRRTARRSSFRLAAAIHHRAGRLESFSAIFVRVPS